MSKDRKKEEDSDINPWAVASAVVGATAVVAGGIWAVTKLFSSGASQETVQNDDSDDEGMDSVSRRIGITSSEPTNRGRWERLWNRENPSEVGVCFNKWRKPESFFGPAEHRMGAQICRELGLGDLDIDQRVWRDATDMADKMLAMLFTEVVRTAAGYRLVIDKFVRQGSAREGLKVCAADEFDVLLQFSIEGLEFEVQKETDRLGRVLPEIGKIRITKPTHGLDVEYRKLWSADAFTVENGRTYLNSRNLHEKVFTSIIDKARQIVEHKLQNESCDFRLDRAINQPAVKIGFKIKKRDSGFNIGKHIKQSYAEYVTEAGVEAGRPKLVDLDVDIDIDIVPALLICYDQVPDPADRYSTMDCPRYAVFKWVRDNHPFVKACDVQPETVWRMDSSGYEKHVLDVARGNKEQRYILTAERVLKAYFLSAGRAAQYPQQPQQLVTVLRSYFLKQLAFYCILFTVRNKVHISGVREALTILIDLLEICLTKGRLPHFFHTNRLLPLMFPNYDMVPGALRYDVFHTIRPDSLVQARLDVRRHLRPKLANFTCELGDDALNILNEFREFIEMGPYF